jgi:hypothetical protein
MSRLLPLSLLLFVLTGAPAAWADDEVERVEIVEWGIYRDTRTGVAPAPLAVTGTTNLVTNVRLQQKTTTIPALVGMTFGMQYKVVGARPGTVVTLRCVTRLPSQGVTNPDTGRKFSVSEFEAEAVVGVTTYLGYSFDLDWEVETGPWTLEIWHDGRKLAEKTFIVTRLVSSAE